MSMRIIPVAPKECEQCRAPMQRKRFGGRLEDRAVYRRRRFCNQTCMGLAHRKTDPTRDAYRKRAHPLRKKTCEKCGTRERLSIHHDDRNWKNNEPSNIKTLCASCHTSLHHARGDINKTRSSTVPTDCARSATPSSPPVLNSHSSGSSHESKEERDA